MLIRHSAVFMIATSVWLTGCGNSGSSSPTSKPIDQATAHAAGRLAIVNADAQSKHVELWSLDQQKSVHQVTLSDAVTALYPSPDRRYALIMQRPQGMVRFLDSGYALEPHGDHVHRQLASTRLLNFTVQGSTPVHVDQFEQQLTVFFDGHRGATEPTLIPYAPAQVHVLSDRAIGQAQSVSLTFPTNMHASAEIRGEYLLAPRRDPSIEPYTSLPTHIDVYQQRQNNFVKTQSLATECPAIHGSASIHHASVFACADGVLLIQQTTSGFIERKILNPINMLDATGKPARIGSFSAHPDLDVVVGKAADELYVVTPLDNSIRKINWRQPSSLALTAKALSYKFDPTGRYLVILDDQGELTLLDAKANFAPLTRLKVLSLPVSSTAAPTLAFSHEHAVVYINDANQNAIVAVDLSTQKIKQTIRLSFSPAQIVWLGWTQIESQH